MLEQRGECCISDPFIFWRIKGSGDSCKKETRHFLTALDFATLGL